MTDSDEARAADLDARYGRSASVTRRNSWVAVVAALAFVVVFVAWLVWGGLGGTPAQFQVQDTGHELVSDSEVTVSWQFSVDGGQSAQCAVQALNSTFAIVGWRIVDIPASTQRTRVFTEAVRTTEQAVSGLIYRCWLT